MNAVAPVAAPAEAAGWADGLGLGPVDVRNLLAALPAGRRLLYHVSRPGRALSLDRTRDPRLHERARTLLIAAEDGRGQLGQEKFPDGTTAYFLLKVDAGGIAVARAARRFARDKGARPAAAAQFAHAGCDAVLRLRSGTVVTVTSRPVPARECMARLVRYELAPGEA